MTTTSLVQICQNNQFSLAFKDFAYLSIAQGGMATVFIVVYWYVQQYWKIDSKKMARLLGVNFF